MNSLLAQTVLTALIALLPCLSPADEWQGVTIVPEVKEIEMRAFEKTPFAHLIRNESGSSLRIIKVVASCGCTSAGDYENMVIESGKSLKINAMFEPAWRSGLHTKALAVRVSLKGKQKVLVSRQRFAIESIINIPDKTVSASEPLQFTAKDTYAVRSVTFKGVKDILEGEAVSQGARQWSVRFFPGENVTDGMVPVHLKATTDDGQYQKFHINVEAEGV